MMYYLFYLIFGDKSDPQCELVYSLLSLKKVASEWTYKNLKIIIYTENRIDLPHILDGLSITIEKIPKKNLKKWLKRSNGFNLSLKVWTVYKFLREYQSNGLFVDTDTYFIREPKELFEIINRGELVMHVKEYQLVCQPYIHAYFSDKTFRLSNGETCQINGLNEMWNSGVIGINSSFLVRLPDMISMMESITKKLSGRNGWHIIEQLVFSFFLQKYGKVHPADDFIMHYWFIKPFRYFLASQFGYYHGNDSEEAGSFLEVFHETHNNKSVSYSDLPMLMSKLVIAKYSYFPAPYLNCLPSDSNIGKTVRQALESIKN